VNNKYEPIKLGSFKKNIIKKLVEIQKKNDKIEKNERCDRNDRNTIDDQRKTSKIILKPIEIKDPRKNKDNKENKDFSKEKPQRPRSKILIKNPADKSSVVFNKFSKTTLDFKFKHETEIKIEKTDITNQESTNMITNMITNVVTNVNTNINTNVNTNINQLTNNSSLDTRTQIRIEDMITLNLIKTSQHFGHVKKMINSNTLTVYAIRVSETITI